MLPHISGVCTAAEGSPSSICLIDICFEWAHKPKCNDRVNHCCWFGGGKRKRKSYTHTKGIKCNAFCYLELCKSVSSFCLPLNSIHTCLFNPFNHIVYRIYAMHHFKHTTQFRESHFTHTRKFADFYWKFHASFCTFKFLSTSHQKLTHLNFAQYFCLLTLCIVSAPHAHTHIEMLKWKQKLKWKCIRKETTNMHTHCLQRDLLVCGAATKCLKRCRNRHIIVSKVHTWDTIRSMVQWNIGQKLNGVMKKQTNI